MLPLSQTAGYALRALRCLEEPGGRPALVEDIAQATGIPRSYLSKLIHRLAKQELVVARRGHHGGVVLAKPSSEITVAALAQAVDGDAWQDRCLMGQLDCSPDHPCQLHAFWVEIRAQVLERLEHLTIADLDHTPDAGVARFRANHANPRPASPQARA